jgi:hypothetical protein
MEKNKHCYRATLSVWRREWVVMLCRFLEQRAIIKKSCIVKPLNAELNPICHLLALLGAHHILHVSRIRVTLVRKIAKSNY